jgi:hypothetical protein
MAYRRNTRTGQGESLVIADAGGVLEKAIPATWPDGLARGTSWGLLGWLPDDMGVLVGTQAGVLKIDINSGDASEIQLPDGQVVNYDSKSGCLSMVSPDAVHPTSIILADVSEPTNFVRFPTPPGYGPIGAGAYQITSDQIVASPDGHHLAVTDYDRHAVTERLWVRDVHDGTWSAAVERPAEVIPDSVAWDRTSRYVAWYASSKRVETVYDFYLAVYDTQAHKLTEGVDLKKIPSAVLPIGWTYDTVGRSVFAFYDPGKGIIALDAASPQTSWTVAPHDALPSVLPFQLEDPNFRFKLQDVEMWSWQP